MLYTPHDTDLLALFFCHGQHDHAKFARFGRSRDLLGPVVRSAGGAARQVRGLPAVREAKVQEGMCEAEKLWMVSR